MRVLFHAVDGTGLGHLVRTGLLARALWERVAGLEVLVATNAADASALADALGEAGAGVKVLRLPYTNLDEVAAGDDPTPRQVNARAFLAAARSFEADLAVFDTHVPAALVSSPVLAGTPRALVLRTLSPAAAERLLASGVAAAFDLLLVPHDLGAPPLPLGLSLPPLGPRVRRVGPLLRAAPSDDERAEARRAFGVAPGAPLLVATMGGGGGQLAPGKRAVFDDAGSFARAAFAALEGFAAEHPDAHCVLQVGTYAPSTPASERLTVLRADPRLPALLAGADLVVSLAGYNTVWEVARAGVPAIFLAKRSRHESQAARAHALLVLGGAAAVLEHASAEELSTALRELWSDAARRAAIRRSLAALAVGDGVEAAADALLSLARAAVPRLCAPPPCENPCTACPVPTGAASSVAAGSHGGVPGASASEGAPAPGASEELRHLVALGVRRVLVACSEGRGALTARLAEVREAGLVPIVETTGRMAQSAPAVRAAIVAGTPARLLLFGLGKKLHQRACAAPGCFGATRTLAAAAAEGAAPAWRLHTRRLGRLREDVVCAIDRRVFFRGAPPEGELPAVVLLRKRWLPYSEGFVHTEATALRRYRPVALCKDTDGERLAGVPVLPLGDVPPDRAAHALRGAGAALFHAVFATCAPSFLRLVEEMNLPLVVSVRGHDIYREPRRDLGAVFALSRRLLARTPEMAADLLLAGAPAEKVVVLPTGVELARLPFRVARASADDAGWAPRVIAVGRFTPKKGLVDALDAFAVLARTHPGARLSVYGLGHIDEDAEVVAAARARCAQEPLWGRVTLHQAVPHAVLVRALAQSDLFLCASRRAPDGDREGLPNALKEAMAVGLPVVTTDHGALGVLVRGACAQDAAGLVVPEGDVAAMGEALCTLVSRRDEWPRWAASGRRTIEARFDLHEVVGALEALYDTVRGEHAG